MSLVAADYGNTGVVVMKSSLVTVLEPYSFSTVSETV